MDVSCCSAVILCHPPSLQEDLRYVHGKGVRGVQLHVGMGGWWTSATTMHVAARLLWDVNADAVEVTSRIIREYYGRDAALASRAIARYEAAAASWQYANVNVNPNLYHRLAPDEAPLPGLREFNDHLIDELEACVASLKGRGVRSRDGQRAVGSLRRALEYVHVQRRILALDMDGAGRTSRRRLEAILARARQSGYRQGLCWDVDSPAAAEGIGGVKYRW